MKDNLFTSFMTVILARDKDLAEHHCNRITEYFDIRRRDLEIWNRLVFDYFREDYIPKLRTQTALKVEFHKITIDI